MTERKVGWGTERIRGEKWTAAMKQETPKRQRERQTDSETSLAIKPMWIHPGDHQLTWQQKIEGAIKQTSGINRKSPGINKPNDLIIL